MIFLFEKMNYSPDSKNVMTKFGWKEAPFGADFWSAECISPTLLGNHTLKFMKEVWESSRAGFTQRELLDYLSAIGVSVPAELLKPESEINPDHMYVERLGGWAKHCYTLATVNGEFYGVNESFDLINLSNTSSYTYKSADTATESMSYSPFKISFGTASEYAKAILEAESVVVRNRTVSKILKHLESSTRDSNYIGGVYVGPYGLRNLLQKVYRLLPVEGKNDHVSIYKNYKDYCRDRRTTLKIGRAIRHILPHLKDSCLESFVKEYLDSYVEVHYTLKTGIGRKDFKHAYSDRLAKSRNPHTDSSRKSLHNSCMRGVVTDSGVSPAEIYASGDFHIAWLEDAEGRIAARVVVRNATEDTKPQAGPVYGVCEQSIDMLEKYLESIEAVCYEEASWLGATLLRLEDGGGLIGPYSDLETGVEDHGDYLEISKYGEYDMSSTSGYISGFGCVCDCCGENFNRENEGAYVENYGEVCGDCLENHFVYLNQCGEYVSAEDCVEVYYRSSSRTYSEMRHRDDGSMVWCDCVDEYWDIDHTTFSEVMEEFVPTHKVEEFPDYFPVEEEEEEAA